MTTDPWHFPRRHLAEKTYKLLADKLAHALSLFAPRRTGKTEFLLKDLGPMAERRGHRVVYASFWQAPLSPLAVLLHALEASHESGTLWDRARSMAASLTSKLLLSGPIAGTTVKAEIDLTALAGKPPTELLLYLDDLLARLARPQKPTLLLLDEVQELARHADNAALVSALRTGLDKNRGGLATVFTGSSREGLQAMFGAREAPFFHFATLIDLPPLGSDFIAHLLGAFERASGRRLNRAAAIDAFATLHNNPYFFRGLLELLLADASLKMSEALRQQRERIAVDLRYPQTWLSLSPLQRATAFVLADGADKPFGNAVRVRIGQLIGTEAPSAARVQAAIRKLASLGLADRWTGHWMLDDPEFAAWVRARSTKDI